MDVPEIPKPKLSRSQPRESRSRILTPTGQEAEEIVRAIGYGEVDAVVVHDQEARVHSLESSERLAELNEMLRAIRSGEVDAFIVDEDGEACVYTWARLEEALHQSETAHRVARDQLQLALAASGAVTWEWQLDSDTVLCTREYRDFYGFDCDEQLSLSELRERVHPDDLERLTRTIQTQTESPGEDEWRQEFRINHPTKGLRWVADLGRIVRDSSGRAVSMRGISFDITERKATEAELLVRRQELELQVQNRTSELTEAHERLRLADRMAAVGALAAGLAHDISNVTLPLGARLNMLLSNSELDSVIKGELAVFTGLVDHLRQMSKNLSLFARDPDKEGSEGYTDLSRWFEQVKGFMEASIAGDMRPSERWIKLTWDFAADLPLVAVSPHRLTQAVLNLVHNARPDAIHDARHHVSSSERFGTIAVRAGLSEQGDGIELSVIDDGIGMDEETQRRCIEPFFTTKDRPQSAGAAGSGMGMAIAYAIAERVGGYMCIESAVGKGTTITLILPTMSPTP